MSFFIPATDFPSSFTLDLDGNEQQRPSAERGRGRGRRGRPHTVRDQQNYNALLPDNFTTPKLERTKFTVHVSQGEDIRMGGETPRDKRQ